MSEVGLTDLSKLLHTKRNGNNAIVASRKRKLRELFAVATGAEHQSHDAVANTDAPPSTPAEAEFVQANEILQGKKLTELTIPTRNESSLDILQRSLVNLLRGGYADTLPAPVGETKQKERPSQQRGQQPKLSPAPKPDFSPPAVSNLPTTPQQPHARGTTPISRPASAASARTPAPQADKPQTPPTPEPAVATPTQGPPSAPSLPSAAPAPTIAPVPTATPPPATAPIAQAPTTEGPPSDRPAETASAQRPAAQVSFPPGTKGSPTEEAKATPDSTAQAVASQATEPASSPAKEDDSASLEKLSSDAQRVPDAPSTPGSTIPSATTPAVHEASTDTSPDHAEPSYQETVDKKSPDQGVPRAESVEPVDAQNDSVSASQDSNGAAAAESAEDQLLQESIRSSEAAATPDVAATPTVAQAPESKEAEAKAQVDSPSQDQPAPDGNTVLPESEPLSASQEPSEKHGASAEIPDSREDTPDQMEVDSPAIPDTAEATKPVVAQPDKPKEKPPSPPAIAKATPKEPPHVPERAVTRVSSGAIKPKSVNEIVGGPPRPMINAERTLTAKEQEQLTPLTSTSQSPTSRSRPVSSGRRDRPKGQVSAVLFGKQPRRMDERSVVGSSKETIHPSDDYYTPLFIQGFARSQSSWMQPLEKVLFHANKTIGTPDANLAIHDHQACKVLHRVYQLQSSDKWTLRQPKRCPETTRPPSHWDVMLKEMKWMRTDFREERKWRMALARKLATACAEWYHASPEQRKELQVPAVIPPKPSTMEDVEMENETTVDGAENEPTPDLIPGDMASPQVIDELSEVFPETTVSPSAIFALHDDEIVFGLRRTAAADQLLEELPMYGPPLKRPRSDPIAPDYDPDAHWRRPALPLSKYVEGQMKLASEGPPQKRSRYDYESESSDDEGENGFTGKNTSKHIKLPPQTDEVALFNPEMKHIRDRLHAGHQFRPPTDTGMPNQSFYECRNPSMWTLSEDDELRNLVREYSYNWPLISSMLKGRSEYTSGAERRTPWECFERWINLEGLPSDMQKTQYFKAYNSRIDAAQRVIMQQNQLAVQAANASGGQAPPIRRRQSTPLRVERRRNQKHLTIIDAMRKLAKKRETAAQKQQHNAAQSAANKKPTEPAAQRPGKTPREYSLMRWERDQALAEKMAHFASRQDATRRAAIMHARQQGQSQQVQAPGTPGLHPNQNGQQPNAANGPNGAPRPNQAASSATARPPQARMPMQAPSNGMAAAGGPPMNVHLVPPGQMNGASQAAQMHAMQGQQQRMQMPGQQQQPDASMMMRAQRISEQQRQAVMQQQAQQQHHGGSGTPRPPSQHNSPPPTMPNGVNGMNGTNGVNGVNGANGVNNHNFVNNGQAMMASFNNANGNGQTSPPANMYNMAAASPGSRPPLSMPPMFQNQINHLETQIRAKNPSMKPEAARQLAMEHLTRVIYNQRQNAMNAAAGGNGQQHGIGNNITATTSPHQYAALLIRQQQQQQAAQAQQQQPQQQQSQLQHPQQQQQPTPSQAASSPGQSSHQRQSSEGATPGAMN